MKQINKYEVRILKNGEKKYTLEKFNVIAENKDYAVINDWYFTKLGKKPSSWNSCPVIGKHSVSEWKIGSCLDGIHYTLYTYKTKRPSTIKEEIREFIDKNYSYIFKVDLSFIK